jgi:pyruvate dehydrogenase E2 component (dihydrolipoamide acetyltransferase)
MALPVHVPRINNNDDEVKLVELGVAVGDRIDAGQVIAQVETDKAVVDVEAPSAGFVIGTCGAAGDVVRVGSVLLWVGERADEPVPQAAAEPTEAAGPRGARPPTAKALALLREHGLNEADVAASGERLSVADIERHLAGAATAGAARQAAAPVREPQPEVAGTARVLSSSERGMLGTVSWARDFAVPGYIEIAYDAAGWEQHAKAFGETHKLLFSPLLPLMAHRLVTLARDTPALNATIADGRRHEYTPVNIGFTVQAGQTLYLVVARDAETMNELEFVHAMFDLQKRAATHALGPAQTTGVTIGFSSMARWKVAQHIPVLPPLTSFMVAHTVGADERAVLGATYDHRVLNGFQVVAALRKLSKP